MAAGAGAAQEAEPPPVPPMVYYPPRWKTLPTEDQMAEAYPRFASMIGARGRTHLRCLAEIDGRLSDCKIIEAVPEGLGFDEAALSLTPFIEMEPASMNGAPRVAMVQFRQLFTQPDEDEPVVAYVGPAPTSAVLAEAEAWVDSLFDTLLPKLGSMNPPDAELDVAEGRRDFVRALLRKMEIEQAQPTRAAVALALARLADHPQMQSFIKEGGVPPELTETDFAAAFDQVILAQRAAMARVRRQYCAAYPCNIPED